MNRVSWQECRKVYSFMFQKRLRGFGGFIIAKNKKTGELRALENHGWPNGYSTLTDSRLQDIFIWIGRYLALKGKLPRHLALEEIAVGAQRTSKAIREVIATEHFEILRNNQEQK